METKSKMADIYKHINAIVVQRRENKFYGTLTDKEGRTFEFSKYVIDIERQFSNTHRALHEDANLYDAMILKYFQLLFVGTYAVRRAFCNFEYSTI